jgi:NADPH:quinone reductase-like Zn-dependent oxidoreductase
VRGVVFDRYGPKEVLRLEEVELPAPKPGAVLVRVHATTATRTDFGLRSAGLRARQRVLVCGASGSIGITTVQMAKHLGAHVTDGLHHEECRAGSLVRARLRDRLRAAGLHEERRDIRPRLRRRSGRTRSGAAAGRSPQGGLYIATDGFHNVAWAIWTSVFGRRKARLGIVRYAKEDVLALELLLAAGEYRPVIDRTYRLEDVVEAHRYVETRQKTGNVVLSLNGGPR